MMPSNPSLVFKSFVLSHCFSTLIWAFGDIYTSSRMKMTTHPSSASHPTLWRSQRTLMLVSISLCFVWVFFFWVGSRVFFFMVYFMFPPASAALVIYILHNVLNCLVRMQDVEELQCCIHSHACTERTLIPDNRLVSGRQRGMRCLTPPPPQSPFSLSWRRHWPPSWIQDEGAHKRAAWHRRRCRELWLKCLALSWGPKAKAAQLRANPAALASISSSLPARILIMPVPSTCCAKHADNPLIHKPTHCHAISGTVDGGGGGKMNSISLLLVSLSLSFLFLDMASFCFPHTQHFLPTFLFSVNFSFCLTPSIPLLFSTGATVLLVNATDLDASREFGQASLIYSLEGSSQFRLNSRSGVCMCVFWKYAWNRFFRYPHVQAIE